MLTGQLLAYKVSLYSPWVDLDQSNQQTFQHFQLINTNSNTKKMLHCLSLRDFRAFETS